MKSIVIIATLDTKGTEALYLKRLFEDGEFQVVLIDVSCKPHEMPGADISNRAVAEAGGFKLSSEGLKRETAEKMAEATSAILARLYSENRLDGVIGVGGSVGAGISTTAMKVLPFGVPKLCVTTVQNTAPLVGGKDIAVLYPVTDLSNGERLNRYEQIILSNAAGAMMGMVKIRKPKTDTGRPLILASMFGSTTPCVAHAKKILEDHGYEVVVFHAQGSGGRAMEEFISTEKVSGVLDITTHELVDEVAGGALSAGPERLEAAGKAGIPQLICPGALDIIVFFGFSSIPPQYRRRRFYQHTPYIVNMRASTREMTLLARIMADKLNKARGPTTIAIPMRGWSEYDVEGGITCVSFKGEPLEERWFDPASNEAFISALQKRLDKHNPNLKLIKVDAHINDPVFASTIAQEIIELIELRQRSAHVKLHQTLTSEES
ncbi:MAG: Tm-1-like ATP-binding domain-containing protein [Candidatus Bathyarchaeia archaeon]